ncbi:unnamed protein product [Cylindrotheca closterium]|uniref:Plastidal glycolate/glycerate translocator 1, chloroplastic n=1 Tax=Cylindrotheca closterium TaxID=2856 RepID=A0AAD2FRF8_9STRA|nr:unnamed protein product [Cylindrotheca closterium]
MKVLSLLWLSTVSAFTVHKGFASANVRNHVQAITSRPHTRNHRIVNPLDTRGSPTVRALTIAKASNDGQINGIAKVSPPTPTIMSAFLLLALDVGFRRLFQKLAISFPSSLGGCCALFISLLTLPGGEKMFKILSPGAALLAKWLPVFFVPSLVTLPLVGNVGPMSEILKIFAVVVGGFFFTLLSTAGSVVGIRKILSPDAITNGADEGSENATLITEAPKIPPKAFSDETTIRLRLASIATGVAAIASNRLSSSFATPIRALFLLSATLHNYVFGARLPRSFSKVVHPLVTCTALTWATATAFASVTGSTFVSMLRGYKTGTLTPLNCGAGDVLLFLLGPAVVSLAISMYDRRKLMRENLTEVVTAISVGSLGGLFGTAAVARLLSIASPSVRLSLLSRNITSPLAMAIAGILGGDVSLAVAMVVVTGLIGANFGASILDAVGIKDSVARGLGIGTAAHGLGTAAIVNEKDAFPFSAIAMALTASACTCLVSIPALKRLLIQLALGV